MKEITRCLIFMSALFAAIYGQMKWEHISSKTGALETPNQAKQQTSSAVADFDNDGINDFCISERTMADGTAWNISTF